MTLRRTIQMSATILALTSSITLPALARDTVIGLSSRQDSNELKSQAERVIDHLTKSLQPGETALFFDASDVRLIATFTAPTGSGAGNPRVMLNANRQALGALKQLIDSAEAVPGRVGSINMPEFLRSVRQNYPADEGGADLIVLGSPNADEADAPSVSMRGGRVPNDAHIAATAGTSIYGTQGLPGSLKGYDVYFGITDAVWKVSNAHSHHMERFWNLQVEGHGASLAFFGDDWNTLFGLAGKDTPDRRHSEPLEAGDKLEMLQFAPDTAQVAGIYTQPLEVAPPPEPVWRAARTPRIGITWTAQSADLDLYVRPTPASPVIYFGNARTDEGQLFKDFTNSPAVTNGFETVALNGTYDLSAMRLAINFYGGSASTDSVSGEIRIAIGDKVWAKPFTLNLRRGNQGAGAESVIREGVAANDGWIVIDPVEVLSTD